MSAARLGELAGDGLAWLQELTVFVRPVTSAIENSLAIPFAPFYDFNDKLGAVLGLPPASSIYFVIMFASICVATVYRLFVVLFPIPKPLRHFYNFAFGVIQCGLMFRWGTLHTVFQVLFSYAVLRIFGRKNAIWSCRITLIFLMCYQTVLQLLEIYFHYMEWTASYLTPVMILTMKLSSVPFNVMDGYAIENEKKGEKSKIPRPFHSRAVYEMPSLLQYLGYAMFYGTITTGPTFEYRDYVDAIEQLKKPKGSVWKTFVWPVTQRVLMNVVLFLTHYAATSIFNFNPDEIFMKAHYAPRLQSWADWIPCGWWIGMVYLLLVGGLVSRLKYYFVWHFAEAISLVAGLNIENCSIWDFETSTSIRNMIINWNKNASLWFRHYIYMRIHFVPNPTVHLALTNFLSAIWHGVYPGYFWFFAGLTMYIVLSKEIFKKVRPRWVGPPNAKPGILLSLAQILFNHFLWNYNEVGFLLLINSEIFDWYKANYFWGHLLGIGLLILLSFVSVPDSGDAAKKRQVGDQKKKGAQQRQARERAD